jgi:hypothetical protein
MASSIGLLPHLGDRVRRAHRITWLVRTRNQLTGTRGGTRNGERYLLHGAVHCQFRSGVILLHVLTSFTGDLS